MKILLVSSYLPYPLFNGGNIRLYNLLKNLRKYHEVTLIAEMRANQTNEDRAAVEAICSKVITIPRKKQWSLSNIFSASTSRHSFLVTGHTLPAMQKIIADELNSASYDLIHVETFYILQNIPKTNIPIVLVEHNIEYMVYQRYAENASAFLKPLINLDVQKIKKEEEQAWKRATIVATVSEEEKKIIGSNNVFIVPNGVDLSTFIPKKIRSNFKEDQKTILYIGDYKWVQNRDAAAYIIKDLWPQISKKINAKLWIVGRNMPDSLKNLGKSDASIVFDDKNTMTTSEIFTNADVLLAPKRVGGGTSYKILEAMACGTPVVTNQLGIEGLRVNPGHEIIVANDTELLVTETVKILNDLEQYKAVAEHGRKTIEKEYDWLSITKQLNSVYQAAIK